MKRKTIRKPRHELPDADHPGRVSDDACLEEQETRVFVKGCSHDARDARRLGKYLLQFADWREKKDREESE
jgi:hypothetical protein